jgi:hypothetical protein
MSEITSKRRPLYASLPMIYDHHDQLWAGTPSHFLDHLYNDFDYRVDDVWLSSYPRSGTAWTYEVLYAVLYEGDIAALQHAQSEGKILKFLPIEESTDNVLVLHYEDMQQDLATHIRRLSTFLGRHLSPQAVAAVVDYASFASMSANPFTNRTGNPMMDFSIARFLRKGVVGTGEITSQ